VTRDDLADGGAGMFAQTVAWIRRLTSCQVEVLVPDFGGAEESVRTVIGARPDVFAHNLEVVERLFAQIRPQGDYRVSLRVLQMAKQMADIPTKSGLMIGLGESRSEIVQTMEDLRAVRCDFLAIGQYLQPTRAHHPVVKYWRPSQFDEFKQIAEELGFAHVESAPLVRSSYGAEKLLGKLS
jgi:lipoic acid synthetase